MSVPVKLLLEQTRGMHTPTGVHGSRTRKQCEFCSGSWPCITSLALDAALANLTEAVEHLEAIREEADQGRFLYATLDEEDAARIMDDCLERIQQQTDAALALLEGATGRTRNEHQ